MATYYMYFPFLTCEVKGEATALDVTDRQNAYSMTLAVRGVTELFRALKREREVHRQILAYSFSHDHWSVRIHGHYPVIEGDDTKYSRHPICVFDFIDLDGREKWAAYQFAKNVYDLWMPSHFKKICSAIDQLPDELDLDGPPFLATGLSQSLKSHHPMQSDAKDVSLPAERVTHSEIEQETVAPSPSFTDQGAAKKRKG
ncbi:hypothetical protein TrVFT333_001663 [Trichoderma virens FT-333]|nr:hypothetical protein TrVFT333_001663 [Trichoderma virens FT-333]